MTDNQSQSGKSVVPYHHHHHRHHHYDSLASLDLEKLLRLAAIVTTVNLSTAEGSRYKYILWRLLKAISANEVNH